MSAPNPIIPSEPMRGAVTKTSEFVLVPREVTPEMARALESNYAECLPASEVHVANWREAYASMLEAATQIRTPAEPVTIGYTNWRGEYAEREIIPLHVWFGATDWHPEPQWLLKATDVAKGAERDFAVKDIGIKTPSVVEEAVKAERPTPHDAVAELFVDAWAEAEKAMRKFPQPNYVISKVAEEAGEVVKAAIHCAEGRDTPKHVAEEIRQAMAMLIRLYIEGDQVHGLAPIASALSSGDAS